MNLLEEKYTLAAFSTNQFRNLAHMNTALKIPLKWQKSYIHLSSKTGCR